MILITGANGLLGARCVKKYALMPETEVIGVWHSGHERLLPDPPSHINYQQCDLCNREEVMALFGRWKIDKVIHTAALLPYSKQGYLNRAVRTNILATANIVDCAAGHGCKRFVYCSTTSVYGAVPCGEAGWDEDDFIKPDSIYGWTKHAGEECVQLCSRESGLSSVSLRLSGIHGPGRKGGVVFHMMRAAMLGEPIKVDNARNRFQLLFLDDAVDTIVAAIERPMTDSFYSINIASHIFTSLEQLAQQINSVCGSKSVINLGNTDTGSDQIMNTTRMENLLSVKFSNIEYHLQQMFDDFNLKENGHV